MFISPIGVLKIQSELEDYKKLCDAFNYSPAKKEFDEIVNYILLQQGGMSSGSMCENKTNSVLDYVYESFVIELNEASKSDDSVVGNWISYLFKKGKVKSAIKKESNIMYDLLSAYDNIHDLKAELANLENKETPAYDFPSYE